MSEQAPRNLKASVEAAFSQVAENYSSSLVHATGSEFMRMLQIANLRGNERVLDAGCGAGHTALAFAPHVNEVVALDLSEAMLHQVQRLADERNITNITLRRGDIETLPFTGREFDLVVSRYSAHHWPTPRRALQEISRVLKHHGQFILADIVSVDTFTVDTYIQAIELLRDPSHVRDHTVSQWLSMLSAAGFSSELVYEWPVHLEFDPWVRRMATPVDAIAMIRKLMDGAPEEVRTAIKIEADHSFTFRGAVLRGVRSR